MRWVRRFRNTPTRLLWTQESRGALGRRGLRIPSRPVQQAGTGPTINTTIVDMGNRSRVVVNEVEVVIPINWTAGRPRPWWTC